MDAITNLLADSVRATFANTCVDVAFPMMIRDIAYEHVSASESEQD
jgi:hypothetical protein